MATLSDLISKLETAVTLPDPVNQVKECLCTALKEGFELDPAHRKTCSEHYARHLLHSDQDGRFSVIAMIWGPGQATPLHDHGDLWCVEGLLEGSIEVCMYNHKGSQADGTEIFEEASCVYPGCGETGHLIPPEDHHIIRNVSSTKTAITIHVYGGDMEECAVYEPVGEDVYQKKIHKPSLDS